MTDTEAPESQPFGEEEMPTMIAGRRHVRTLTLPKLEAPPPPDDTVAAAPESSRHCE